MQAGKGVSYMELEIFVPSWVLSFDDSSCSVELIAKLELTERIH